jgi:hypothetical protein
MEGEDMMKKLILLMALLLILGGSANAWEYVNTYHDYITSSFTVAVDSSDSGFQYDTSGYQWYNIAGSKVNVRFRYKTDVVYTAGADSYFVYIDATPDKGDDDSTNLYQSLYSKTDATPSTSWEYTSFLLSLTDSTAGHENWKMYFINGDTLTATQAADSAGQTHEDTLEVWIEIWK